MTDYYVAVVAMAVALLFVMALLIAGNKSLPVLHQRRFFCVIGLIAVATCAEFLGVLLSGADPSLRILHIAVKFIELSIAPVIPVVCALAVYPSRCRQIPFALLGAHAVLELLSAFWGFIYFVDAQNVYHHCALYVLYYVAYTVGAVYYVIHIVRFSARYQNQKLPCLAAIIVFIAGGIVCQIVDSQLRIVWLTVALGFTLFYVYYCDLILQIDVLTGFLNRAAYNSRVERLKSDVMILFFDIDHFKQVNDAYGHSAGDECLKRVAAEIRHTFGKIGLCYRFGGDEFCVITNRTVHNIEAYMSAYFRNMDVIRRAGDSRIPNVSVGYAEYRCGDSIEDVVAHADHMMYAYKQIHHSEP